MDILVISTVLLNMGDAAILRGMERTLRDAFGSDVRLQIHDTHAEAASRYYPDLDIRPMASDALRKRGLAARIARRLRTPTRWIDRVNRLRFWTGTKLMRSGRAGARLLLTRDEYAAVASFRDADLVVSTGGTYLVENYSLDKRLFDYGLARFFDTPLVFFTQSLGPFRNEDNQRAFRPVFDDAALVLLRDERSRRHLVDIGVRGDHLHVAADAAFALAAPDAWDPSSPNERPRVAVSVRDWRYFKHVTTEDGMDAYAQAVREATAHLVTVRDADVVFVSTCQGIPEYTYDDSAVAERIVGELSPEVREHVRVDRSFHTPDAFQNLISTFDLVIATRMHAAILSLGAGVPVLPIEYEFKTRELFDRLGFGHLVHDIETIRGDALIATADSILELDDDARRQLARQVQAQADDARSVAARLADAISRRQLGSPAIGSDLL